MPYSQVWLPTNTENIQLNGLNPAATDKYTKL